jgi:hypothetical protein
MDLSGLKWPLIIVVVVVLGWLVSEGGVNFMFKKFTETPVDQQSEAKQVSYEAGLSRLGGFLLLTLRISKAEEVLSEAVVRYPEGENALHNQYRLAKCYEKLGQYRKCAAILRDLRDLDAHDYDDRIPEADVLQLRIDKLAEVHELGETGNL